MVLVNYYIGGVKLQSDRRLFFILVIVLIINISLLWKVGDLINQVQNLRFNYNSLQSSINSISGNVNSSLDRFTREQSWITPVRVDDGKTRVDGENGLAVLNWQVKDFKEGAEVCFITAKMRTVSSKQFRPKIKVTVSLKWKFPLR